ncbi:alpha/beta hydrolase [Romeria aff. gracilis LEGE 07310]|uniref:Alpha/beta hydrolase n=1 Tax=Vasconcelosia minhoensis LEGE 07310 TaxID=915328 RepID=A0A8J7AKR6_9CYAN|nr:alpha/beta hydrolase [Romeria gracilis]MBE9075901.1 alpha/beta hydrolase [Romeria aff. gracilis LEGE 07310]
MADSPDTLWLSASPYLKCLDRPLLQELCRRSKVYRWDYFQSMDEPCCLETALTLLHDYLSQTERPMHLVGHGISGVIGLLYARRYPERVSSLALLSVAGLPAVTWQAHYYQLRQILPCSRTVLLAHMVRLLFGVQPLAIAKHLTRLLEKELDAGLSLHSLYQRGQIAPGGVSVPLLVCCGQQDIIVAEEMRDRWRQWLKAEDRLWQCKNGQYFFHQRYAKAVGCEITMFQRGLAAPRKYRLPSSTSN